MKIQGLTARVTGDGSGLGEATTRKLARQGAKDDHLNGKTTGLDGALRMAPR